MAELIESLKFKAVALTPIHIGCRDDLDPMGYVVSDKTLNVINLDKLLDTTDSKILDDVRHAVKDREIGKLRAVIKRAFDLRKNDSCIFRKASVSKSFLEAYEREIGKEVVNNALVIKQHISTMDKTYLPGSSIKGAIRTGILEWIFTNETCNEKQKKLKDEKDAKMIEAELLGYAYETAGNKKKAYIKEDPFKLLKIKDSYLPENATEICVAYNYNKNSSGRQKGIPYFFIEVVKKDTEFEIEMVLASYFDAKKKYIFVRDKFLQVLQFISDKTKEKAKNELQLVLTYKSLNDTQKRNLSAAYEAVIKSEGYVLRVGFGSGYDFITVKGYRFMEKPVKGKHGWGYSKNLTENDLPLGFIKIQLF